MADRLPWFPLYVSDFLDDPEVHHLSYEQIGIYFWLLCRQWQFGGVPAQPPQALRHMLPDTNSAALALVLHKFFPLDPDSDKRVNPKLAAVRAEQESSLEAKRRGGLASKGNLIPGAKHRHSLGIADGAADGIAENSLSANQSQSQKQKKDDGVPSEVLRAADPYLREPKTRDARIGTLRSLLQGMTGYPISEAALVRGLTDMAAAGTDFRPVIVRTWAERAQKLLEGEAGAQAARESLKPSSSVLGQPDANPTPWAEDELG